jgi:hypothetical protein
MANDILDDPNTQAYKSDFLAGKFADSGVINTPTQFGPKLSPEQEVGMRTPNTNFVYAGISNDVDDDSPLSRDNSRRDRLFESQFGSNAIQPHVDAANATETYHALTARHSRLLNHARLRADSADYLHQSGQVDPTSENALEEHINNKTLFPGALGDDVDASDQHFATIYNQHQRATGQGWNTLQNDIKAGHITNDQIKRLPDGSVDYYTTHMLANEQGGALARQKIATSEETPEARLFAKALEVHKIPEPDQFLTNTNTPNPDHSRWATQKAWANTITENYMKAHPNVVPPGAVTSKLAGPSPEFQATVKRFNTPGQVESLPKPATVLPMKGAALVDKYR